MDGFESDLEDLASDLSGKDDLGLGLDVDLQYVYPQLGHFNRLSPLDGTNPWSRNFEVAFFFLAPKLQHNPKTTILSQETSTTKYTQPGPLHSTKKPQKYKNLIHHEKFVERRSREVRSGAVEQAISAVVAAIARTLGKF